MYLHLRVTEGVKIKGNWGITQTSACTKSKNVVTPLHGALLILDRQRKTSIYLPGKIGGFWWKDVVGGNDFYFVDCRRNSYLDCR